MADPKQLIFQDAEVALPDTYTLPPGLDLALNSIVAFIDGSGAAGDFKPALAIFAQSGQLMARVPTDQEFAAGDSGVVTWAPFLRRRSTSTPPPPSGSVVSVSYFSVDNFTVTGGDADVVFTGHDDNFDAGGHAELNGSGNPQVNDGGIYLVAFTIVFNTTNPGVTTSAILDLNVISGSLGTWSSKLQGASEAFWYDAVRVDHAADPSYQAGGSATSTSIVAWDDGDTFPAVMRLHAETLEDNVDTEHVCDFRLTVARLGAGDV